MCRLLAPVTASVLLATLLAACGGGSGQAPLAGHQNKQLALAQCMRAHGVSNFPDPSTGSGGGEGFSITATPGSQTLTIDGSTFSGPAFATAERDCKLFGGGTGPPAISAKQKQQLVNFARCMRAHGVSDWADPSFPPAGGAQGGGPSNPNDRNGPKVQRAARTCNRLLRL